MVSNLSGKLGTTLVAAGAALVMGTATLSGARMGKSGRFSLFRDMFSKESSEVLNFDAAYEEE